MTESQTLKIYKRKTNLFEFAIKICKYLSTKIPFKRPALNFVYNEPENIAYAGPEIWVIVLQHKKQKKPFETFKYAMKT